MFDLDQISRWVGCWIQKVRYGLLFGSVKEWLTLKLLTKAVNKSCFKEETSIFEWN